MECKVKIYNHLLKRLRRKSILFALALSVLSAPSHADLVTDSQVGKLNVIKLLANLGRFVTWPDSSFASADAPMQYCIAGRDDIGTILDDALGGANAGGRKFKINRFGIDQIDQVSGCQLIFIGVDNFDEAKPIVDKIGSSPIISVAQIEGFTDNGGMVQFIGSDRNVTLRLNKEVLESTPLVVSSKLYGASQH